MLAFAKLLRGEKKHKRNLSPPRFAFTYSLMSTNAVSFHPTSTDERQDVQQKTFTKWINHHLNKGGHAPIKNLFEDLRDGHKLLALLETLTNKKYVSR